MNDKQGSPSLGGGEHSAFASEDLHGQFEAQRRRLRTQQTRVESVERRIMILWLLFVFVVVSMILGGAWGYRRLQAGEALIAGLPDREAIDSLIANVNARADSLVAEASALSANSELIQAFSSRLAALESSIGTRFASIRNEVRQDARKEAESRVAEYWTELAGQVGEMTPRLEELERSQEHNQAAFDDLSREMARMRSEVAGDIAALRIRSQELGELTNARLSGNERSLEALSREVGRERLDFELFAQDQLEVAPGTILHISDTDVSRQKVDGWLHLVEQGRIVRFEDHPVQEAFVFYDTDPRPYELVFTRVKPNEAIGFLRVPIDDRVRVAAEGAGPGSNGLTASR